MSYILDALRRAEAERERGAVPGLNTQPPASPASRDAVPVARPWLWPVSGVVLALAIVLAWSFTGHEDAVQMPVAVATPPPPAPVAVIAAPPPAVVTANVQQPAVPAPLSNDPVVQTLPEPKAAVVKPAPAPQASTAPASAAASAPARVYAMSELPDDVRKQMPVLTVGGLIHSPDPAKRVLILNGQLYHEHDKVAADTTLLQIEQKNAVLQFRSVRFRIDY